MSFLMNSVVHAASPPPESSTNSMHNNENKDLERGKPNDTTEKPNDTTDYMRRAQWLRASVLGANDGLVSVASMMIGVGAASSAVKAMLISGLAGLVAGACSMAIGEFVSVYTQYDIEKTAIEQENTNDEDENKEPLANPWLAAGASALAFSIGGLLPLLAGAFIKSWGLRLGVLGTVSSFGLVVFGALGALFGGANPYKGALRVLIGGWIAMLTTYGVLKLFSSLFHVSVSSV